MKRIVNFPFAPEVQVHGEGPSFVDEVLSNHFNELRELIPQLYDKAQESRSTSGKSGRIFDLTKQEANGKSQRF